MPRLGPLLIAFGMCGAWGCAVPPRVAEPPRESVMRATVPTAAEVAAKSLPQPPPPAVAKLDEPKPQPLAESESRSTQAAAMLAALADLQRQGAIDEKTHDELLSGLKQTDPALWPQLVQYFQAAAAKQKEQPPSTPPSQPLAPRTKAAEKPEKPVIELAKHESTEPEPTVQVSDEPDASVAKPKKPKPASSKPTTTKKPTKKPAVAKTTSSKPATPSQDERAWQESLAESIRKLERETESTPASAKEVGTHATLRMMYLMAGRREDALKPIAGLPAAQQDFWSKELYGLAAYLDVDRNADAPRRAAEANAHFRDATARLGELATLQVRNLTLCREVTSYGVYKRFDEAEFEAGQEVLVYAEVENFKSQATEQGFHTALKASYQILDERGARVDEKEFAITEEYCQNPRRDFFVRYFVWMPQRIYGGSYTLQLSIEDMLGQKLGQASASFKIKGK